MSVMRKIITAVTVAIIALSIRQPAAWSGNGGGSGTGTAGVDPSKGSVSVSASIAGVELRSGGGSSGCSWTLYDASAEMPADQRSYPFTDPNGVVWDVYLRNCAGKLTFVEVPRRTAADLLVMAERELKEKAVPKPVPILQPLDAKFGWTYVHVPLDFRVSTDTWKPVMVTAHAGPVFATVTATPARLTFDPGDDHNDSPPPTSCGGTDPVVGYEAKFPGACSYTYRHASSTSRFDGYHFMTTTSIEWSVSWVSSTGAGGVLPGFASQTQQPLAVAEVQGIVCQPGTPGC